MNELTSSSLGSYTYDANGNTLSDPSGNSYTWDFENRLTQAVVPGTNGGTTTFKYDPFGRRIEKISPTTTSIFVYDGPNLIETVNASGSEVASYTQAKNIDEPLAELRGSTTDYYEADGLGSVTSLSNSTGTLANTYAYDSLGNLTASTGTARNYFQYVGREFDPETGLYFNRARYFDPSAGRFLSQDPIRFGGGANFYAYTRNNPLILKDPWGYQGCPAQSPNCVPTDSNAPYQGSDGLWYNVPDWSPPAPVPPDLVPPPAPGLPPPPGSDCKCKNAQSKELTVERQLEALSTAWRILDAAEQTGFGVGLAVGGVATTVYVCVETGGFGCSVAAGGIVPPFVIGGYYITRSGVDELEEIFVNDEDCP
ncbi:MAG: RHS repeat-associated core domain-containing protein [Candidatus Sulfotelmatobacter sp.]